MKTLTFVYTLVFGFSSAYAGISTYRPNRETRKLVSTIDANELMGHIRFLSSDLLEGRGPASTGDTLAQTYIASQFETLGLTPAAEKNSWLQEFDLVGVTSNAPKLWRISKGRRNITLEFAKDYMAWSGEQKNRSAVKNAEIVFVGYGIEAPEYEWDDYKGVDLKGKVLLMMNNDPADDPKIFEGKTRLYYGRWTYKYEIAAKKGAVGAIIIHTTPSAGYPWQVVKTSWDGEQFKLPYEGGPTTRMEAWVTEGKAREVTGLAGKDLDKLRAAAEKRDFKPVPLGISMSMVLNNKLRKVNTANVLGMIPGSDRKVKDEVVIYMAHHDHLGRKENAKKGEDAIYNGALDNASGVAGLLAIARAYSMMKKKPRRSILFAAVGAEEQGLFGSAYLARHPVVHPGKMSAVINMDGMNIWGETKDITYIGKGKSTLDSLIDSIAKMQGRVVNPDQFPDKGYFYRSDQFNLAKIGVPAAYFDAGIEMVGKPVGWGRAQMEKWTEVHYHQPSDEMDENWNLAGAIQDLELNFYLGYELAEMKGLPMWNKGDEFEAARLEALKKAETSVKD